MSSSNDFNDEKSKTSPIFSQIDEADDSTTVASPEGKKRRGRPKKAKEEKENDADSTTTRSSKRLKKKGEGEKSEDSDTEAKPASKKARGRPKGSTAKKKGQLSDDDEDGELTRRGKGKMESVEQLNGEEEITIKKKTRVKGSKKEEKKEVKEKIAKKRSRVKGSKKEESEDDKSTTSQGKTPRKKKKIDHQRLTERDTLEKLWNGDGNENSYTLKICSWNVAGLRALLRNHPNTIPDLVKDHDIDILCLQETKLQESHLDDPKLKIRDTVLQNEGYDSYWSCSTAKKGYSGTAVFVKRHGDCTKTKETKQKTLDSFFGTKKKKGKEKENLSKSESVESNKLLSDTEFVANLTPTDVSYKMGVDEHDAEGRLVIADFPLFSMINCYVPNSGQKLERLDYRTERWDKDLLAFAGRKREEKSNPILWLGDLNVAHTKLEVWNDGAKHLPKQAGVTPQERASFQAQLDSGYIDAFRKLHPDAKGCYTYWSQRAGNREPNKGLRLDYFICSPELFDTEKKVVARDSYILYDVYGSDHCPVVLELEIKK